MEGIPPSPGTAMYMPSLLYPMGAPSPFVGPQPISRRPAGEPGGACQQKVTEHGTKHGTKHGTGHGTGQAGFAHGTGPI